MMKLTFRRILKMQAVVAVLVGWPCAMVGWENLEVSTEASVARI